MVRLSWTQPICETCWKRPPIHDTGGPEIEPARLLSPEKEKCAFCGDETESGIYVRRDPLTVNFPAMKED